MADGISAFERSLKQYGTNAQTLKLFQRIVYNYFRKSGRSLPWRNTKNPYRILVSEIMLQQTQVDRVIPAYKEFIRIFPDFQTLADAPLKKVLKHWQGLGYNRRALMLQKLSKAVVAEYGGILPSDVASLEKLPGVGIATASAVAAFAFNTPSMLLETNIRSVYLHFFFSHSEKVPDTQILPLIERTLDRKNPREWYWALMDYGSMLKKKYPNPSRRSAQHQKQSRFQGSNRQLRGLLVRTLLAGRPAGASGLAKKIDVETQRVALALLQMEKEGLVERRQSVYRIASR